MTVSVLNRQKYYLEDLNELTDDQLFSDMLEGFERYEQDYVTNDAIGVKSSGRYISELQRALLPPTNRNTKTNPRL